MAISEPAAATVKEAVSMLRQHSGEDPDLDRHITGLEALADGAENAADRVLDELNKAEAIPDSAEARRARRLVS